MSKIYINGSILHEEPTGLGVYAKNVIKNMVKFNKDIEVFCPVDIENVKVIKITEKVKPSYKKKGGLRRFLWTQFQLPFKVSKKDILYHPFQYISMLSNARQVITIHDFIPLYYPEVAKHQYHYYKKIMPVLLKKAKKIICISNNTKKDLLKFYKVDEKKVKVVYNGYDNELFNTNNKDENVLKKYNITYDYMIMVGASYPHKNLESALKAYSLIKDKTNCKLVIVGKESNYIKALKALSIELKIEDKVVFLGYVGEEELPSLYAYSKGFVYPTLYEGFGLPILEAAACGIPVICSEGSSLPEAGGDSCIYFNPENIEDISKAMLDVLTKEDLRQHLIAKGKENLKRFSWEKTSREIYDFIK